MTKLAQCRLARWRLAGWRRVIAATGLAALAVLCGAFAPGAPARAADSAGSAAPSPIGVTTRTFVDDSRPTDANGTCAELPSRTLVTTVYYPAAGGTPGAAQPDAAPAGDGRYPLIVFAHGFSATADSYQALLEHWAGAGYVVAAPTFPLSSGTSPCGAVAGDVVNQPKDMSFVITSVLDDARGNGTPLSGLIDAKHIGAAGHSNGAITTYGLVGNTKLRDERVDAAVILAGTAQKFPEGKYDLAHMPPVLFGHGTDDSLVPYSAGLAGFNAARGPKGLLSITNGDHGSSASAAVEPATTDFFDAYLRGDTAARDRLPGDQTAGVSTMKFAAKKGSRTTVPTTKPVELHLKATVTPRKNLHGGQMVTVAWSGYTPGKVVNILQCNGGDRDLSKSNECDYSKAALLHPDPTGEGSVQLEIVEGPIGTGTCDAAHPGCFIIVNNASSTDPKDSVQVDISFAP
jgi:dienelactone hydrolase